MSTAACRLIAESIQPDMSAYDLVRAVTPRPMSSTDISLLRLKRSDESALDSEIPIANNT